jgi:ABC-type transporter Mla MlaB component
MFRVSETKGRSRTVVNIDGQLVGDYVRVVEDCCSRALERAKHVDVLLRDVSAVDQAGRDLLCRLVRQGVRLRASGVYLSHLVKVIERCAANLNQPDSAAKAQ